MAILQNWATGDDEPCDPYDEGIADRQWAEAERDYLAARESLKRIRPEMDHAEVWRIQDRFYRAQLALNALNDGRRWDADSRPA